MKIEIDMDEASRIRNALEAQATHVENMLDMVDMFSFGDSRATAQQLVTDLRRDAKKF